MNQQKRDDLTLLAAWALGFLMGVCAVLFMPSADADTRQHHYHIQRALCPGAPIPCGLTVYMTNVTSVYVNTPTSGQYKMEFNPPLKAYQKDAASPLLWLDEADLGIPAVHMREGIELSIYGDLLYQ